MKKILMVVLVLFVLLVNGCQCDLSHKHYYNDRGVCVCGDDIAQELIYDNKEYSSSEHSIEKGKIYYYKLKSHGEEGIDFYLESEDAVFNRIEIRADNMLQTVAGMKDYDEKHYVYENNLIEDFYYYFKITYNGSGYVKLLIKQKY